MSMLKWNAASENARRARWTSFPPELQEDIDEADRAFRFHNGDSIVKIAIGSQTYKLDFEQLLQINLATGYKRKLFRAEEVDQVPGDKNEVIIADANGTMQWDAGSGNGKKPRRRWRQYPPDVQDKIDEAFMRQNGKGAVRVTIVKTEYLLDLNRMKQTNLSTGFERSIRWAEDAKDACASEESNAGKRLLAIEDEPPKERRIRLGAEMLSSKSEDCDNSYPPKEPLCVRCGCRQRWQGKTPHCCSKRGHGQCVFP